MAERIQLRRGSAAEWGAVNPILADGEVGVVIDQLTVSPVSFKVGDGTTPWLSLPWACGNLEPRTITTTSTYTAGDTYIRANSGSAIGYTLPAATGTGRQLVCKNIGVGTFTITADGSDLVDGNATLGLAQWGVCRLIDIAAGAWDVISN